MSHNETSQLRIVFMGSPEFAVPSLEKLAASGHEIVGVVTGVDKKRGRGNELSPTVVKSAALNFGLSVIETDDVKSVAFEEALSVLKPDLLVVVAFKVLPANILKIPAIGSVNLHASLLPKYRGAAPIHWAVMNGEKETGVTVFFLDEQIDTGNYLLQSGVEIGSDETTGDIYKKLMDLGAEKLREAVDAIASGTYQLHKQDDTKAIKAPKLFQEHCIIRFDERAEVVHNQIRGLSPLPTAYCILDGKKLKVYKSKVVKNDLLLANSGAGQILSQSSEFIVGCGQGAIELLEVQLEGKKRTDGASFLRGYSGQKVISVANPG